MKAAQIRKYGSSEVVEINKNAPVPVISHDQILVEVYAAGVNPVDWKVREGYMRETVPLKFPATLGGDFSGVVTETGAEVSDIKKGDEVFGQASALRGGSGSFAEFVSTDTKVVSRKPRKVDHVKAAALPLVGVSAWQALVDHIGLSIGKKILIHGGAGGIGTMAIQLAKYLGAYVTTTVSARDLEYARELGADEAIDYKGHFEKMLHDYDAVFDTVGGETYVRSFEVLRRGGIIVSMLEQPRADLMKKYGVNAVGQFTQVNNERLSRVAELADKNILKAQVEKTFPLEKAREALDYLQTGHPRGKVVLKIK